MKEYEEPFLELKFEDWKIIVNIPNWKLVIDVININVVQRFILRLLGIKISKRN